MCGICGIVQWDGPAPSEADVVRMRDSMAHRGPDGSGWVGSGACVLGHRRLSIIDVEGSPQPMSDPATGCHLVYNGEIYNYRGLRRDLEADGEVFRTHGDTEVLLKVLVRDGASGLARLNGIFAFGFWDPRSRRLLLGRDRLGVKPLYYHLAGRRLAFASEIKALLQVPGFRPELDEAMLPAFFMYANVHGPATLLSGVRRLPPGTVAEFDEQALRLSSYWSLPDPHLSDSLEGPVAVEQLAALLDDSVRLQMVSDVPVGSLCSGGLDSSLISAMCVRRAGHRFNTFNATFPQGPPFDESPFALSVAAFIGSQHHEIRVEADDVARALVPLIWHNDEPIHHSSSIPIYYVARRAASHVKVLLSGEGADEMFAGYPRYRILRGAVLARNPIAAAVLRLGARTVRVRRRREKLLEHLSLTPVEAAIFNVSTVRRKEVERLLMPTWKDRFRQARFDFERQLMGETPRDFEGLLRRTLRFEQGTYLVTSLDRLDKMAMAASIEGRVPFLDHRIPELSARLSLAAMLHRGRGKEVLRQVARGWVPDEILTRPKWGFGLPMASILRHPRLAGFAERMTSADSCLHAFVDRDAVRSSWDEFRAGRDELADLFWRLLNLDLWHRLFVERSLPPPTAPEAPAPRDGGPVATADAASS